MSTWHADHGLLTRYRHGELGHAHASSVEAHVVACAECQRRMAELSADDIQVHARLDTLWASIADAADAPRVGPVERLLILLRVSPSTARLLSATPSLQLSWFAGVAISLALAVVTAHSAADTDVAMFWFLLAAPLLPIGGVAFAFGPAVEPAYEIGVATPMHGFRLLLVRTTAVLVATLGLLAAASVALPAGGWRAAAWLVPALALTTITLVLSTRWSPRAAATAVGTAWLAFAVATTDAVGPRPPSVDLVDQFVAFQPAGQAVLAALLAVGAAALAARRDAIDLGRIA